MWKPSNIGEFSCEHDTPLERHGTDGSHAATNGTAPTHTGYLVAFDHMYFPGIGRIKKETVGYRWLPIPYINDAAKR